MVGDLHERSLVAAVPHHLLIDGEWRAAASEATFGVEDPATGALLTEVADGSGKDAAVALDAAVRAQAEWAATSPRTRGEILRRAFESLVAHVDDFALLITLEMGKPLAESRGEVLYAAEFLRWFAESAVRIDGRYTVAPAGGARLLVTRQPVGPCVLITPWNFPLAMATRKIAPAVAAGCTMVLKPAELAPLSSLKLADTLIKAGLPAGVLNVVTTSTPQATTGPIIGDARTRKLSFTGSTAIGKQLLAAASEQVLRVSMELGGNAPFLVFADADLDAAVDGAVVAKMRNVGEACTAANRFLVHESLADEFTRRLASRLGSMKVGRGTDHGVEVGPLIDRRQRDKVVMLVDDALDRGARVVVGGQARAGSGYFYEPTVLVDVADDARLLSAEIFGPVAPIRAFATDDEAIAAANDTEFGLVAYAYTGGLDRALRVVESLDVGMVAVNQGMVSNAAAPFGGVKHSGIGREGSHEGIDEYLETKYAAISLP